jgi:dihydrofolate reductase
VIRADIAAAVRERKERSGEDMVIMGSGTIVSQLTEARLIDEYMVIVNPIVLGRGRTLFEGVSEKVGLRLMDSRAFKDGNVVQRYRARRVGPPTP